MEKFTEIKLKNAKQIIKQNGDCFGIQCLECPLNCTGQLTNSIIRDKYISSQKNFSESRAIFMQKLHYNWAKHYLEKNT